MSENDDQKLLFNNKNNQIKRQFCRYTPENTGTIESILLEILKRQ